MTSDIYDIDLHVVLSPAGDPTVTLSAPANDFAPVSGVGLRDYWWQAKGKLEDWTGGKFWEDQADEFAQLLSRVLFPAEIRPTLTRVLERGTRVRMWLCAEDPRVRAMPWEAAHAPIVPEGKATLTMVEGLSFMRRSPVVRFAQTPGPVQGPVTVKFVVGEDTFRGLKLGKLSSPEPLLEKLRQLGPQLQVDALSRVTWDGLASSLQDANILHFSGHSVTDEGEQALVFRNADGAPDYVRPRSLGDFHNARNLRLVVLAACSSGRVNLDELHAGWSALHCGAVVAMQAPVIDESATAFAEGFYAELARSGDLDDAVAEGRQAMRGALSAFPHADAVVVYARYPTGPIRLVPEPERPSKTGAPAAPMTKTSSKPLVRRYPVDPEDAELTKWLDGRFSRATGMDSGELRSITPFVGPGTLQIEPAQEQIRWDSRIDREARGELATFVAELFDARAKKRVREPFEPTTEHELSLSGLRLDLARLAHVATTVFVETALARSVPLNLWDEHGVPLPTDSQLISQLRSMIASLTAHLGRFGPHPLFGETLLRSRLENLLRILQGRENCRLTGSAVEWLTDLFWHAVVFDSPLYPHVAELSLQVSLLEGRGLHPIRHLDPNGTVIRQNLGNISLVTARAVARGFDEHEPPTGPRRRFFQGLAEVLHAEYAHWRKQNRSRGQPTIPLALTGNFDLELERGLAAHGKPYHVAVPVYIGIWKHDPSRRKLAGEADEEDMRWLIGTFGPTSGNPTLEGLRRPLIPWRWLSSLEVITDGALELHGPLVLKLNGSPLHDIPRRSTEAPNAFLELGFEGLRTDAAASDPESESFKPQVTRVDLEHAIALGEFDFLQVTRMSQWSFDRYTGSKSNDQQGLPPWLITQIRKMDRYWLLLGYRFADWNSRTQMHTFLAHAGLEHDRGCAVSLEFDPDRIRFLDWLGITQARGHVEYLTERLHSIAAKRLAQANV